MVKQSDRNQDEARFGNRARTLAERQHSWDGRLGTPWLVYRQMTRERPTKTNKDRQRPTKTDKDRQRPTKTDMAAAETDQMVTKQGGEHRFPDDTMVSPLPGHRDPLLDHESPPHLVHQSDIQLERLQLFIPLQTCHNLAPGIHNHAVAVRRTILIVLT